MSTFQDESTDCAICLEPLIQTDGSDESENNIIPNKVLTLQCGHKWHYDCLVQQLQTAQSMTTSHGHNQRLIFTGCQCAKCGRICEHEELEHLTRATDRLRVKVDALLEEQLQSDAPDLWKTICQERSEDLGQERSEDHGKSAKDTLLDEARRKYAFYLCSHCKEPYFGGTIECADEFALESTSAPPEQRLCTACAPQSQVVCRNPQEHGRFLIWKCRYCCQPSTHVCYGNVHFCDSCHQRNSQRVQEMQHHQQHLQRNQQVRPPPLEPIPCLGKSCCFPKRNRASIYHDNGPSPTDCEQVYSCAFCESSGERGILHMEPGSNNLLVNPSGELGLDGWKQLNRSISWEVEESELPLNATTTTNFVSSFMDCVMLQEVKLSQLLQPPQQWPGPIRIEVSARYMGRTDCPSVFRMEALLSWGRQRGNSFVGSERMAVLARDSTPTLDAPPDYWETARLELILHPSQLQQYFRANGDLSLHVVVIGKDGRFWQGRFGSKVASISARILGTPNELDSLLIPAAMQQSQEHTNAAQQPSHQRPADTRPQEGQSRSLRQDQQPPGTFPDRNLQNQNTFERFFRDFLLPAIIFALLAWLATDGAEYRGRNQI